MADGQPGGDSVDVPDSTPVIPEGHTVISESDLTTLRRQAEQVSGMKEFYDKARSKGFDKATAFDEFDPDGYGQFSELTKSGMDLNKIRTMAQMFTQGNEAGSAQQGDSPLDLDSIRESLMGEVDKRLGARDAEHDYRQRYSGLTERVRGFAREVLGEDASDAEVNIWSRGLMSEALERGQPLADDHPLRDRFGIDLPGDEAMNELFETAKQARVRKEGEALAELGDKANKPAKSTAAGSSTDKGAASEADTSKMSMKELLDHEASKIKLPAR